MSGPLDEAAAWRLVRGVAPGSLQAPTTIALQGRGDARVTVWPSGRWEASVEPTEAARSILDLYLPIRTPADLVVGQLGQSLDGRIATETGSSHFVTGGHDLDRLHRVRALVDAVVVGARTVEADDPQLTVRRVEGDHPARVVLDPSGRLDGRSRVFTDRAAPTLVVRRPGRTDPVADHVALLAVPEGPDGGLDLPALLESLRARGLRRILVEGGGITVSRFLAAGLLDRLHVTVAPLVIGSGRPSITLDPIESLDRALRPRCRHFLLGRDVLFDLDLRAEAK